MRHIRLTSNQMVNAAGVLAWAMNGYRFKRDQKAMVRVMQSWPGLTETEWRGVLSGKTPHKVEGDEVLIDLP